MKKSEKEKRQKTKNSESESRSRRVSRIAVIAGFSLVGLAVIALAGTVVINLLTPGSTVTEAKVSAFKNNKEIVTKLKSVLKDSQKYYSSNAKYLKNLIDNSIPRNEESDTAIDNSEKVLNNHSAYFPSESVNVDDTVKTDEKYIYYLPSDGGNRITVFSAEKENSKYVSEIVIHNNENEHFKFKSFFTAGKMLYAIEEESVPVTSDSAKTYTRAETFDISDIKNIKSVSKYTQSGKYCASRIIDSKLYLTTVHHCSDENDLPLAAYGDIILSDDNAIAAENIYYTENPNEPNFMVIGCVAPGDESGEVFAKAILGSSDDVYFSEDYLYVTSYEFDESIFDKQNSEDSSYIHLPVDTTQLVKVDLKNSLNIEATARISGYIDCQYSFDETDDNLRVATAVTLNDENFSESANMFILDDKLNCVGKLTGFASDETIKAVRYIDDTAYVMTYKDNGPLYILDLKNSKEPQTLGETKSDGFSSTLIAADNNTLLSIGYYTAKEDTADSDGVRIVTFDVSNKTNPKKIDEKIYKSYESPVQYNANSLLISDEKRIYTIPMIYEYYNGSKSKQENKYGALLFTLDNGKLNVVNDYTSTVFTDSEDSTATLDRCVSVDDCIYLLGSDYNYYKAEGNALIDIIKTK